VFLLKVFRMLYEFHRKQNVKKAGSVHAIYHVIGLEAISSTTNGHSALDEDTPMQSSPPFSSSMPLDSADELSVKKVVLLVKEERLEGKFDLDCVAFS
jgi:DNA polymerase delta subunit 3